MNLRDMKKEKKKGQFMFKLCYHGTALLQNQPKKLVHLVCNTLLVGLFYVSPIQKQ